VEAIKEKSKELLRQNQGMVAGRHGYQQRDTHLSLVKIKFQKENGRYRIQEKQKMAHQLCKG
jgi:hypothetical protein